MVTSLRWLRDDIGHDSCGHLILPFLCDIVVMMLLSENKYDDDDDIGGSLEPINFGYD